MYIRPVHAELDVPTLHAFVREYPLGLFTTAVQHPTIATLQTTHIPFVLDTPSSSSSQHANGHPPIGGNDSDSVPGAFPSSSNSTSSSPASASTSKGTLRAHMARANPQCKALLSAIDPETSTLDQEVLVLFQSPTHSYVTPRFYTESKPKDGKVVPTWNYAAVQVYGKLRVYHRNDDATGDFLQSQVEALTALGEPRSNPAGQDRSGMEEGEGEWKVADAPVKYVEALKRGIVGLEITIDRIEGRFKLSQEDTLGDWRGVVQGFRGLGTREGDRMAEMVEARGRGREAEGSQGVVA